MLAIYSYTFDRSWSSSLILVTTTETLICITQFSSGPNKGRNPHLPVRFLPQLPEVSRMIFSFEVISSRRKTKWLFSAYCHKLSYSLGHVSDSISLCGTCRNNYSPQCRWKSRVENGGYLPQLRWIIVNYVHVYCVRSYYVPVNSKLQHPRAFEFLENFCSNSPLPRLKSCSKLPHQKSSSGDH